MEKSKSSVKKFLRKLFDILNNEKNMETICWDQEGERIIIKNVQKMESHIIPSHFRLKKMSSFIRQLHLYNFHKDKRLFMSDALVFHNELFHRYQPQLAQKIIRKRKTKAQRLAQELQGQNTTPPIKIVSTVNSYIHVGTEQQISGIRNGPYMSNFQDIFTEDKQEKQEKKKNNDLCDFFDF